jgi:molecular chaperone DnaK (HSP70)
VAISVTSFAVSRMAEIGIDFGTPFSKLPRLTRHGPEMITMDGDMLRIPSEVTYWGRAPTVGLAAADLSCESPTMVLRLASDGRL